MKKKTHKAREHSADSHDDPVYSRQKGRPPTVRHEFFVKVWTESTTVGEAAERLGIKPTSASSLANRLRGRGVALKHFPRRVAQPVDVRKLNKIASGKGA